MRIVTTLSVALFDVDRSDERLDVFAATMFDLAQKMGLDRPAITSETQEIPSFIEERLPEPAWDVTRTWRGVEAQRAVDAIEATIGTPHDEVEAHRTSFSLVRPADV